MKKLNEINYTRLFESNKFLKILSVIIAIFVWLIVVTIVDSSDDYVINKIPLTISTAGTIAETNGLEATDQEQQYVSVKVTGKRFEITKLKPENFKATLEITDQVTLPGTYDLKVNIVPVNVNIVFENFTVAPSSLNVAFDRRIEKIFPLEASVSNKEPPTGYIIGSYTCSPQELAVKGSESIINSIDKCILENTDKMEIKDSTSIEGTIKFLDSTGQEIDSSNLVYKDTDLKVSIPLYKKATIPLKLNFINVPKDIDPALINYSIEPAKIEVAVPADTVPVDSITLLPEIDFRKLTLDKVLTYDINLLASYININDVKQASVKFDFTNYATAALTSENILLVNPPSGYTAEVITKKLSDINFIGKKEDLAALTAADVIVTADLSVNKNATEGEQHVPVKITLSNKQQAWAVGEYSVLVSLKKAVTQ